MGVDFSYICTYLKYNFQFVQKVIYNKRNLEKEIIKSLKNNPVTAIIGPRQCGKSTLAKYLLDDWEKKLYLDLERPSDMNKLEDPEWFLESQKEKLICLDEIQRKPHLFAVLRSLIDQDRRPGMYLVLGSAGRDLLRQSSESLAGRIAYKHLSPFLWNEISHLTSLENYLSRGGFPPALLAGTDQASYEWRQDFITTFLERDLMQFSGFSAVTMRRLWQMLAHSNGHTINYSSLAGSLGVSHTTIKNYVDLMEGAFMLLQIRPYIANTKKRLVKSPRIYLTDTGMINALLQLKDFDQVAGHPGFGTLWETLVINNLVNHFPALDFSFYRTNHGSEIDLVVSNAKIKIAIECKASLSPQLSKQNYSAISDIDPFKTFVVIPSSASSYPLKKNIDVHSLDTVINKLQELFHE